MEKHRNLSYLEQLLEDINRAEQDRFEVRKLNALMRFYGALRSFPCEFGRAMVRPNSSRAKTLMARPNDPAAYQKLDKSVAISDQGRDIKTAQYVSD